MAKSTVSDQGLDRNSPAKDGLMNLAVGKSTCQSSVSEWSKPYESTNAVSGVFPEDFAFHTSLELDPFWQVDLGEIYPLECITVHNRIGSNQKRARRLKIEVAQDEDKWTLVHSGYSVFGGGKSSSPLLLNLGSEIEARYVRISLIGREYLHLSQVEILARPEYVALGKFCRANGLRPMHLSSIPSSTPYSLEWAPVSSRGYLAGLKISYSGRFGNLLHQYINVIQIAERAGLKFIQLGKHELFDLKHSFEKNGITFLPHHYDLPGDGCFLCGEFFNSDDFNPILAPFLRYRPEDEVAITSAVQQYIVPHILSCIPLADEEHPDDELTIHLRSGDIFDSDHPVTFGYRQPPLSFYILVIKRMQKRGVTKVRMVFEDRGNPCIDALEQWLNEQKIVYRLQSKTLVSDMSSLVNAPHLVFGHGTFGYAACRLSSSKIKSVHYFSPELGGRYGYMPTINDVYDVFDREGKYIKAFQYGEPFGPDEGWRNTKEMRQTMLSYPEEWLEVEEIPRNLRSL